MLARMPARAFPSPLALLLCAALAGCSQPPPFAQLAGLIVAPQLNELSGMAASRVDPDTFWVLNDGGSTPTLYAIGKHGGLEATVQVDGVTNTDWEDLDGFDLAGRHYLLIADTGDNGGLRRTLQLHIVEEPRVVADGHVRPAWSIVFRWPDGPRDCEAVAVDAARGQILLISKRRRPPELFVLPLRPATSGLQVARSVGHLAGIPEPDAASLEDNPRLARMRHQVTAANLSPDGRSMAVLTYSDLLVYRRKRQEPWEQALLKAPMAFQLPWLPQAEALAWAADGRGLYVTGEHSPAPLLVLNP
ncbi:MAG: putative integral rane domain protein [Xanthomonadaceae bacterium]|nr:putative integral rane domain protein [Xanthomonadaceae bacterium]